MKTIGITVIALFLLLGAYNVSLTYTIESLKADNEKLYADNKKLVAMFDDQMLQSKLLKQAGWKDEKIDEFVGNGCLMYFEIGGNMK